MGKGMLSTCWNKIQGSKERIASLRMPGPVREQQATTPGARLLGDVRAQSRTHTTTLGTFAAVQPGLIGLATLSHTDTVGGRSAAFGASACVFESPPASCTASCCHALSHKSLARQWPRPPKTRKTNHHPFLTSILGFRMGYAQQCFTCFSAQKMPSSFPPPAVSTQARAVSLPSVGELVDEAALTAARGIDAPLALEDGEDGHVRIVGPFLRHIQTKAIGIYIYIRICILGPPCA